MFTTEQIAALRITVASPAQIRSWSSGEVIEPTTLNYLTGQPEPGGLFCERIFGPTRDWSCFCGKYRRKRSPGFVCAECGVEITTSAVRRVRMGHIQLSAPVAHPWFARYAPSVIALLLGMSQRTLDAILSYSASVVTHIDEEARRQALTRKAARGMATILSGLQVGDLCDEEQHGLLSKTYGRLLQVGTGPAAIRELLAALDLDALSGRLRETAGQGSAGTKKRALKRLHVVECFRASGVDPAWMILTVLPVLPPDLRPLVALEGGKFATSDANALYERVIHRNKRVQQFRELNAPTIMLNNEMRLLQEACNALFDNGHQRRPLTGSHGQRLKSLTDALGGKKGRLRRNILGKRVDYSGRSVIVGDPSLQLHQCGLPTSICLELFKPFLIRKLIMRQHAPNAHAAKRMVERARKDDPVFWDLLEEVMHEKLVLLNRAPTLHRLSIQAFEALRMDGDAIRLHPLVCSAFNADFDGDQMAVHLPLSDAAQAEARQLLLSVRNLRSPATGEPSIILGQDIALGLFYLTQDRPSPHRAGRVFADATEALQAMERGIIDLHTRIVVRAHEAALYHAPGGCAPAPGRGRIETTAGRLLFNEALPPALRYRNYEMTKERLKLLVAECLRICGDEAMASMADALKLLGFHYATKSGTSFALSDIQVPPQKKVIQERAERDEQEVKDLFAQGMITIDERDRQVIALWTQATEEISQVLEAHLDPYGALATIIKSGATKAKFQQIRQLGGIRGLMARPSGEIIPIPIKSNYLLGQSIADTYTASSAGRKGFSNRSRDTSKTGYLTRRLVEAAVEVWITQEDCGVSDGLWVALEEGLPSGISSLHSRLWGRVLAEDLAEASLKRGILLDEEHLQSLLRSGARRVSVRSPLRCQASYGICRHCYGSDLATGQLVRMGTAVGIIAAQSIGEPGTQLTMRTFHSGGIAGAQGDITLGLPRVEELFEARTPRTRAIVSEIEGIVAIEHDALTGATCVRVVSRQESNGASGSDSPEGCEERTYRIAHRQKVLVEQGQAISAGLPLCTGALDPPDILRILGRDAAARYLVDEVQAVFRATGVYLHDKHAEVVVRQMLRFVQVRDGGDTPLLPDRAVDRFVFERVNARVLAEGGSPAYATPVLFGLTRVALNTRSWLAAASFQQTSRVLAWAAIAGEPDKLLGYKEAVLLSRRIPV